MVASGTIHVPGGLPVQEQWSGDCDRNHWVEQNPALSAFRGESGVGTTLPMNVQTEKNFLFITTKFFYENFLTYGAFYLLARLEFIASAFRTGQKTQGGKHPDTASSDFHAFCFDCGRTSPCSVY
jgi:hypothetical protein